MLIWQIISTKEVIERDIYIYLNIKSSLLHYGLLYLLVKSMFLHLSLNSVKALGNSQFLTKGVMLCLNITIEKLSHQQSLQYSNYI